MSKDLYMKLRKSLVDKKDTLFPNDTKNPKQRAENMANTFFIFASNKPKQFGVYKEYAKDDINELIAHYEEDLKEIPYYLDADHLTRLA